jgi:hypothetical protein
MRAFRGTPNDARPRWDAIVRPARLEAGRVRRVLTRARAAIAAACTWFCDDSDAWFEARSLELCEGALVVAVVVIGFEIVRYFIPGADGR